MLEIPKHNESMNVDAGHIIRMEEEKIPKRVLKGNFHTT
jgi:hypothetical protein